MPPRTRRALELTPHADVVHVAFNRRKYGRHLLVDVGWIHELTGFLIGPPHALAFYDITLVTRGRGWFWLDGERMAVRPGTVLFSRPGQVRRWDTDHLDGICLFFEELFVTEFLRDDVFMSRLPYFQWASRDAMLPLKPSAVRSIRRRLSLMQQELVRYRRDSEPLLRAQLHEVLIVLARLYAEYYEDVSPRPVHPVVTRYLTLLERDVASTHTIAAYATELAVTPGYLRSLCLEHTGLGAKPLLDRALIARASRLLLYSDATVERISSALGFKDPSYFSRFFRRECGVAPTVFRRRHRSGAFD